MRSSQRSNSLANTPSLGKFERTRVKLVQAIREEISQSGDFSADLVARRSGSSPANFYNHFATKDAALIAAYNQLMTELVALVASQCRIELLLDQGVNPFMSGWVIRTANFFSENAALFRLIQATFGRSKELRDLFKEYEADVIEIYRRFIELGQTAKLIRPGNQVIMAHFLAVFSASWHHSLVQKMKAGDPLHDEFTHVLTTMLSPAAE
jgi:AcrR family transcriptional regulator